MDVPNVGEFVTVSVCVYQSGVVDRSYIQRVWRVVAVNELVICLEDAGRRHEAILVSIGERSFSVAPLDMIRAMCGDAVAAEAAQHRSNSADLERQLDSLWPTGATKGGA